MRVRVRADPSLDGSNVISAGATGINSASSELVLLNAPGLASWNKGRPMLPNVS